MGSNIKFIREIDEANNRDADANKAQIKSAYYRGIPKQFLAHNYNHDVGDTNADAQTPVAGPPGDNANPPDSQMYLIYCKLL